MKEKQQMKKLMFTAALAAMSMGAFAAGEVYEMTINVKTTEAKSGTVYVNEGCYQSQSYRKQTSMKIAGLFWGCECATIAEPDTLSADKGVFFWNGSKKAAFYDQEAEKYIQPEFAWVLLNRIGQKAADCEGVWELNYGDAYLYGAGFGKCKNYEEETLITSMSGNCAGTMNPGNACKRCEDQKATAWPLCECGEFEEALTAAYGTWSLKFNSSASKKFNDSSDWSWYKWPGDVLEAIKSLIEEPETDTCAEAKLQLVKLQAQLATLEDNYTTLNANISAYKVTIAACNTTNDILKVQYKNATNDAYNANFACTNLYWEIDYTNASLAVVSVTGRGAVALKAKIADLQDAFSLDVILVSEMGQIYAPLYTWKAGTEYADDLIEANQKAAAKVTEIEGKIATNNRLLTTAKEGLALDSDKLEKLDYANTKAQLNAQIGTQKAIVDQVCD